MKAPKYHMFTSRETQISRYRQPSQEDKITFKASCWGEEDKTVVRSSILFLATSNASFVCSAVKLCTGRSRSIC